MQNKYEAMVRADWEKFSDEGKEKLRPNIMLLGATGCGKSSLVNTVFGDRVAAVSDASRGTEGFHTYLGADHGLGVNLIDSYGYELAQATPSSSDAQYSSFEGYEASIEKKLQTNHEANAFAKIHLVWYCISVAGGRVQDYDIKVLRLLEKDPDLRGRIAIVLTKCDQDDENGTTAKAFKKVLTDDGITAPAFEVSADPTLPLDLDKLVAWSASQLDDEDLKEAFVASQMIDLKQKKDMTAQKIKWYAGAAAGIGAVPIPISDSALLIPLQITMATRIISIYGLENLATISAALVGDVIVGNLGKAFAGGLLKLIPGIGSVAGAVINASVASSITYALGSAISTICYDTCKKLARGEKVDMKSLFSADEIKALVSQYMKLNKNI